MANKVITVQCLDTRRRFYIKLKHYPSGLQLPTNEDIKLTSSEWKQLKKEKTNNILLFKEKQIIDNNVDGINLTNIDEIEVGQWR